MCWRRARSFQFVQDFTCEMRWMYEIGQSSSITSHQVNGHIEHPKFTSCTVRRSSNKMQRSLLATSCEKWYQHFNGSYRHASLDSQVHHTFQDAPPHLPMSSKKHQKTCVLFHLKTKKSRCHDPHQLQDDTVTLRLPLFGAFSFPHLSQNKNDYISPKKRATYSISYYIYVYIYCIIGSSNQLGLVVGSQLGLFVVSSLGAKHGAFHSEDETQKVGSSGGHGVPKRARHGMVIFPGLYRFVDIKYRALGSNLIWAGSYFLIIFWYDHDMIMHQWDYVNVCVCF